MKQEHIDKVKKALPNWQGLGIFESCKDLKEFFNDKRDFDLGFAAKLIMKFPEFDKDCDLSRFGGEALTRILLEREELIDRCDLTKLRGDQWARLIVRSKHFAEYCIWDTFDGADWVYLIGKREEFADKCDWPMLTGKDWVLLILKNEEFADKCDWPMLTGKDWALLLSEKDGLAEHCDFTLLSNEEWDYLLACKPNYCTHRPKKKSILRLTLKKRWFLLGLRGTKLEEFRVVSDWISSRLIDKVSGKFREYDEVEFRWGYGADRPVYRREFVGVELMEMGVRRKRDRDGYVLNMPGRHFKISVGKLIGSDGIPAEFLEAWGYCQGCDSLMTSGGSNSCCLNQRPVDLLSGADGGSRARIAKGGLR